jgi:hypothetical protein
VVALTGVADARGEAVFAVCAEVNETVNTAVAPASAAAVRGEYLIV